MLDVPANLLVRARVNSGLSCKDSAVLVYSNSRNWCAWEDGQAKMPAAIFELFLVRTGQKVLKAWPRSAGILEPLSSPPGPDVIKLGRNAAELTQSQAAQLVHVTPGAWQKWELGKAKMHPAIFELFMLKTGWALSAPKDCGATALSEAQIVARVAPWFEGAAKEELNAIKARYSDDVLFEVQQARLQHINMSDIEFWCMYSNDRTIDANARRYAGALLRRALADYQPEADVAGPE